VDSDVIDPARLPSKIDSVMSPVFFTPAVVKKYIKHLRNNASPGPDGVPAEFYKATASFVSFSLSVIMAALWYRAGHNIFALWFLSSSIFFIFLA